MFDLLCFDVCSITEEHNYHIKAGSDSSIHVYSNIVCLTDYTYSTCVSFGACPWIGNDHDSLFSLLHTNTTTDDTATAATTTMAFSFYLYSQLFQSTGNMESRLGQVGNHGLDAFLLSQTSAMRH